MLRRVRVLRAAVPLAGRLVAPVAFVALTAASAVALVQDAATIL